MMKMKVSGALVLSVLALAATISCSSSRPPYIPRNPELRRLPVYFYPTSPPTARAMVFFFGNDIGFWAPHRDLAEYLSGQGYAVVGFDMRTFLAELPESSPQRDSAFEARILPIIASTRHEIHADSLPLVIVGHSLGAEVAIWTAAFAKPPGTVGVIAMSPGLRSHLRVTASDLLNGPEPNGPGSFSVPVTLKKIQPEIRVAIVRGDHDKYRYADSALLAAGGNRTHSYIVPFASHSLKRIIVARPVMRQAMSWLLERVPGPAVATGKVSNAVPADPGK
jgi:pimeloyl-ACP methyl ester carboxylesterase